MKPNLQPIHLFATLGVAFAALCAASGATLTWSGAGGTDLLWSTPGNWSPAGPPGAADAVLFNDLGATNASGLYYPDNFLSASRSIASLAYGQTNGFHNTFLNPGVTLTVSNNATGNAVFTGTGTDAGGTQQETATVSGAGAALVVIATNVGSAFNVRQGSTVNANHRATLDLSGLDTLNLTVGRLLVAGDGSGTAAFNRPNGTLILALTNTIRVNGAAPAVNVGDGSSNGGTEFVQLGQTNALFADSMTIARQKCIATLNFNPALAGYNPGLYLRGNSTSRMAALAIGDNSLQSTSGTGANGNVDLSLGAVDAQVDTCYVARGLNGNGGGAAIGALSLGTGVFDVNILEVGYVNINTALAAVTGTVNVNAGGTLVVNNYLRLGRNPNATNTANATLKVIGGAVRANSITTTVSTYGTVNSTIDLTGSTLALTNTAGAAAAPLAALNIADSRLVLTPHNGATNIFVASLTVSSSTNNTIDIASLPLIVSYPAQYPLISYASINYSDFLLGSLPAGGYTGYLSNNTTASTIDLVITGGPITVRPLVWNGTPSGDWDTTTANWLYSGNSSAYSQNDFVTFDDSASGTTTVNLTTSLTPGSITVSNLTKNYTFSGSGSLGGPATLIKDGASQLTLANSGVNTFTNGVSLLGGTLLLSGGDNRLPTNASVTFADVAGATLDLNNLNQTLQSLNGGGASGGNVLLGSGTLTAAGGGNFGGLISGSGRLIKTNFLVGGTLTLSNANTYTGGTIVGGYTNNTTLAVANQTGSGTGSGFVRVLTNGTFVFGAGGPGGSVAAGILTNNGTVRLNRSDDFTFTNVIVGTGSLQIQNINTVTLLGTNSYTGGTFINQGLLRVGNPWAVGSGTIFAGNGGPAALQLINDITLTNTLNAGSKPGASGIVPNVENISGSNTLSGPIQLTANGGNGWLIYATGGRLLISGPMTPLLASQTSQNASRPLWLRGDADGEWSGNIIDPVNSVTNLALRKDGLGTWILSGANTYSGPTVVSNGTLLVNGSLGATNTVTVAGGTLGGRGVINGPVTIGASGTLAPGTSIGGLTINNSLTLGGTTVMEVSHAATDRVTGLGTLTLGGTLQVLVQGTLTGAEVFKLFSATNYTGDFATYDLPTLTPPLAWDYSKVPLDGTLRVTGGTLTQPALTVAQTGNQMTFAWSDVSFKLQAQTNSLSVGLGTNWADYPGGGASPVTITVNPANPTVFFRLVSY